VRPYLGSLILFVAGLALVPGGFELLSIGGSSYYLLAGLALAGAGTFLALRSRWGFRVYALTLAATVAWALWEADFAFWPLLSRIGMIAALGLVFLLPSA